MPIPNVSTLYQRIHSGSEGGHEFARLMKLLLQVDYGARGINFVSESDASGDFKKVDAYIPGDNEFKDFIVGFQFKFYPNKLTSNQRQEIVKSIEDALSENEFIQELNLVTPEDWQKDQLKWFEKLKLKYEKTYWAGNDITRKCHFKLHHWGHTKIVELSLKHDHIALQYFPELFPLGVGKFKLAKATLDSSACAWVPFETNSHSFYLDGLHNALTTDPVFDFQFKNSTSNIHLLNKIEIHIEDIRTKLKGLRQEDLLMSVGTIKFPLDFTMSVNEMILNNPLVLEAGKPKRFSVQLLNVGSCPGNYLKIKFWFYFDEVTVPTNSFTFSL